MVGKLTNRLERRLKLDSADTPHHAVPHMLMYNMPMSMSMSMSQKSSANTADGGARGYDLTLKKSQVFANTYYLRVIENCE